MRRKGAAQAKPELDKLATDKDKSVADAAKRALEGLEKKK